MGRKKTAGTRSPSGRKKKATTVLGRQKWDYGNAVVQLRRSLFAGVRKNQDGKTMDVSDDVADAPGQLHALGFFDNHGHEPDLIRDTFRNYAFAYWNRHGDKAPKVGQAMRSDRSKDPLRDTRLDIDYERMWRALEDMPYEESCIQLLVVDYYWRDDCAPFVNCLVNEKLIEFGKLPQRAIELPTGNDREILGGALRAAFRLIETGLQAHVRRAA